MSNDLWDEQLSTTYEDQRGEESFFELPLNETDKDSEKKVHTWLMTQLSYLQYMNRDRHRVVLKNLALYKGEQYKNLDRRDGSRDNPNGRSKSKGPEKIVMNELFDLAKSRISKLLKYKPAVAILPSNDEWEDGVSAKMTKMWLDHIWYSERFDGEIMPEFIRNSQPMGESYVFVDWDKDKGDESSQYKQAVKGAKGGKIPLLDENGTVKKNDMGKGIYVDKPVYDGEVEIRVKMTTDVFPERPPIAKWRNVNFVFERDTLELSQARLKYPKRTEFIKADADAQYYNYESMEYIQNKNLVTVWTIWHRRTPELNTGRKIVFTKDGILDSKTYPFSHRNLPCVRLTDIDVPGELHGRSFFQNVKAPTGAYNNMTNMILRNIVMVGHPKWMMPAGSAKVDDLGNTITTVQFKGPIAPQLVAMPTTPKEVFEFRALLKEDYQRYADVGITGKGEAPQGITAAVALQYLSELENERWNELVLKYNEAILQIAIMCICVAGDFYHEDDERMIRILGKNNEWMTTVFAASHLNKDYDVRIQSTSALPDSKAAKTEYLLFLNERFPDKVDGDAVLNMLDLAQTDKFINIATVSIRAAEAETQMLMQPDEAKKVLPPSEEEDHIEHWKIHVKQMREWSFKNRASPEIQQGLVDHVMATEALIVKKIFENPQYAELLKPIIAMGFPVTLKTQPDQSVLIPSPEPLDLGEAPPVAPYQSPVEGGQPIAETPNEPIQGSGAPTNDAPPSVATQTFGEVSPSLLDQSSGSDLPPQP